MKKFLFSSYFLLSITLLIPFQVKAQNFTKLDEFVTTLNTKRGQVPFRNVIQGLAQHNDLWITSQTSNDKFVVLNFFKNYRPIQNLVIPYPSHAQDLSVSYDEKNKLLHLYTVSKNWQGIVKFTLDSNSANYVLKEVNEYNLSCKHCTSTISKDNTFFASKDGRKINIYSSEDVFLLTKDNNKDKKIKPISSFNLVKEQTEKGVYFQGIAMQEDTIFTLSGNASFDSDKWLVVYNAEGKLLYKDKVTSSKDLALKEGNKYEPEGLELVDNILYTTFMSGYNGRNIKRLYKILKIN